jgi:hypothetical protein
VGALSPSFSVYDFVLAENTAILTQVNKMERAMNLSAPTMPIFLISLVMAILAVVSAKFVPIPVVSGNEFWVSVIAYVVLLVGNVAKGL